jgi:hypothetical protein
VDEGAERYAQGERKRESVDEGAGRYAQGERKAKQSSHETNDV